MLDLTQVQDGSKIEYIGDSFAFGSAYTVVTAESTYKNPADCPESEKGKLMIIEFTNADLPMFFALDKLDPNEWQVKS